MSREVEERFITKILEWGSMEPAISGKISKAHFTDLEMREVWAVLEQQHAKFGALPSLEVLQSHVLFEPVDCSDVLEALMDLMREKLVFNDMVTINRRLTVELGQNPDVRTVLLRHKTEVNKLVLKHADISADVNATANTVGIMDRYELKKVARATNNGIIGLPWIWPYLNERTGGINKTDEFAVVYGEAKSYKTWVTLATLCHVHKETGETPLFVTKEMSVEEVTDRAFCIFSGLPWDGIEKGRLTPEQEMVFKLKLEEFKDAPPFHIVKIESMGIDAVVEYEAKIEEYDAKIAAFDGVYFLSQTGAWQEIMLVTRAMRQLSLRLKVPMFAVTQGNAQGFAMYSKSFQQDATIMVSCACSPENRAQREVMLNVPFARNAIVDPFSIHMSIGGNMSQKHVFESSPRDEEGDGEISAGSLLKDDAEDDNPIEGSIMD